MMPHAVWERIQAIIEGTTKIFNGVAAALIVALMLLVTADVILRKVANSPIPGAMEVDQIMMVGVALFSFAYCWLQAGHIRVEFLTERFSPRLQAALDALAVIIGMALFALLAWHSAHVAIRTKQVLEVSDILGIPCWIERTLIPMGCVIFFLQLVVSLINDLRQIVRRS